MRANKIVVISHDASLSGAPVLLLNLFRLLNEKRNYQLNIVIKRGGPVESKFRELAPTLVIKPQGYLKTGDLITKAFHVMVSRIRMLKAALLVRKADLIFNNTITNGILLKQINRIGKPVITYVHELENVAKTLDTKGDVTHSLKKTSFFLYPSLAVARFLERSGVASDRMKFLPYFFPFGRLGKCSAATKLEMRKEFATRFNLPLHTTWVVSMGTVIERKGYDIFIEANRLAQQKMPGKYSFIWIGATASKEAEEIIKAEASRTTNAVVFTGAMDHNYLSLAPFDLFFSASREDPYPLVVLEAAFLEIPSICFNDAGGIREFVAEDAGWVIPGFSPQLVIEKLEKIDQNEISVKGQAAYNKVMELHADEELVLANFDSIMAELKANL